MCPPPLQVTHGARGLAETTFPEDTVADRVGGARGRRYYAQLSDDEDLLADEASGGNVARGGTGGRTRTRGCVVPGCPRGLTVLLSQMAVGSTAAVTSSWWPGAPRCLALGWHPPVRGRLWVAPVPAGHCAPLRCAQALSLLHPLCSPSSSSSSSAGSARAPASRHGGGRARG